MTSLPRIVIHKAPPIQMYFVTEDQLNVIEAGCSNVGQDFTFASISISLLVACAIALLTTTMSGWARIGFLGAVAIFTIVFIYTGLRWWRTRKSTPSVIARIRKREDEPSP